MQKKQILLARPNQYLGERMTKFFTRNSYSTQKLASLDQLPHISAQDLHGIVISTSAISDIKENYASVYSAINKRFPDVPVAFTVTSDKESMHQSIKQNLMIKGIDVMLMSVSEAAADKNIHGKIVLVIHEDDLPQASSDLAAHHFFK